MVKYEEREHRIGKDYEIQFYDNSGNNSRVVALKTAEDLGFYLSAMFWGSPRFLGDFWNPTIYHDGKRYGDWSEITIK